MANLMRIFEQAASSLYATAKSENTCFLPFFLLCLLYHIIGEMTVSCYVFALDTLEKGLRSF